MNRPLYETQQDRDNEQALARIIEKHFDCTLTKMPMKLSLDYMLSLYKVKMANELTQATGLPCFLVVQWSDKAGIVKLPPEDMYVAMGGSTRRNDPQDIEPMVYFDVARFKEMAT
jgi:hypothetical protein